VVKNEFCCICAYFQTTRIKFFLKIFFNVWSGKKRALVHLRILSDHQKHGLKLMLFNVCCGNVRVLMHLRILPDHQNQVFFLKIFFNVWSGFKRVLMHLRILPDQKTCFGAFAHTFRPPETWAQKWCYLTSEVVMYVFWCIYAYFQTTRIKFLKKIFFNVWSG
jgi:hypothetical protein